MRTCRGSLRSSASPCAKRHASPFRQPEPRGGQSRQRRVFERSITGSILPGAEAGGAEPEPEPGGGPLSDSTRVRCEAKLRQNGRVQCGTV